MSEISHLLTIITRRVPIIKMEAQLGVEVDCSIGGMNGADTSLYALQMCQKYQRFVITRIALKSRLHSASVDSHFCILLAHSFSPVVLALKIIMGQQNLVRFSPVVYLRNLGTVRSRFSIVLQLL